MNTRHATTLKRMHCHISVKHVFLLLFCVWLQACVQTPQKQPIEMPSLVSVQWLNKHLNHKDLIVIDATVFVDMDEKGDFHNTSGLQKYQQAHIPHAVFADLIEQFATSHELYDFVMPSRQQMTEGLRQLGVGDDSKIVVYSAANPVWATRMWWMLKWAGFDEIAVLDGGLSAWQNAGYDLSSSPPMVIEKPLNLTFRPKLIASTQEVSEVLQQSTAQLIDAMPSEHFNGQFSLYARPGHIPGAINIPSSILLDESGLYKPMDVLRSMIKVDDQADIISYCGGGVAASSVAFTLYRLGYTNVSVYMDSLQHWAMDRKKPLVTTEK